MTGVLHRRVLIKSLSTAVYYTQSHDHEAHCGNNKPQDSYCCFGCQSHREDLSKKKMIKTKLILIFYYENKCHSKIPNLHGSTRQIFNLQDNKFSFISAKGNENGKKLCLLCLSQKFKCASRIQIFIVSNTFICWSSCCHMVFVMT